MPTKYTDATEQMVLEEFRKKIDQEEGISAFEKSESPDGIICDIMMPGIDGISLCRLLRDKGFKGPFILLTVIDQIRRMGEGLIEAGADRYMVKPCDIYAVRDQLEELLFRETT